MALEKVNAVITISYLQSSSSDIAIGADETDPVYLDSVREAISDYLNDFSDSLNTQFKVESIKPVTISEE